MNVNYFLFSYEVQVTATNIALVSTSTITVHVEDINDHNPAFMGRPYVAAINEDAEKGDFVINIDARDFDRDFDKVIFKITSGDPAGKFKIEWEDGIVTVAGQLDREVEDTYTLDVTAYDNAMPPGVNTAPISITILDINDNNPVFVEVYTFYISESLTIGSFVGEVFVTDADINDNSRIKFSLVSSNPLDHFRIEEDSGRIRTTSDDLDRESYSRYSLLVRATDYGQPSLFAESNVTVILTDHDDIIPLFHQNYYELAIPEDTKLETRLFQFTVNDFDLGINQELFYEIEEVEDPRNEVNEIMHLYIMR